MKKISLQAAALFLSWPLFSAPVGNTAAPQLIGDGFFISRDSWVDLRLGYEGDFVQNGRMIQEVEGHGRVDCYKQSTNSGTVTLNVLDRLDLFGVLGSSSTNADWRFTDPADQVNRIEFQTDNDFLWAVGGRGVFFEWSQASLGLGGRYAAADYRPDSVAENGTGVAPQESRVKWSEWQINLDVSYKIDLFTPYLGVKYSNAKASLTHFPIPIAANGSDENHFKNNNPVGIFLGCSLSNGNYFMLNLEARLVDEEAVTVSGDLRF